jgi:hypothetical protein
MSEPFLTVSLGEVRARGIQLETDEAVAIVLSLGERLGWRNPPRSDVVLLTSSGRVDVRSADEAAARTQSAAGYALLLHELVTERASGRSRVPPRLYGAIASALAQADASPASTPEEFASELRQVLSLAPAEAVIAVMLRWAEVAASGRTEERRERRSSGPNVSELRRQLRESDLHRYALLSQLTRLQPSEHDESGASGVLRLEIPLPTWRSSPRIASSVLERFRRPGHSAHPSPAQVPTAATAAETTTVPVRLTRTVAVACAAWLMGAGVDQTPPAGPHTRTMMQQLPVSAAAAAAPAPSEPSPPPAESVVLVSSQPDPPVPSRTTVKRRVGKARKASAEPAREPEHRNKLMRFVRRLFSA